VTETTTEQPVQDKPKRSGRPRTEETLTRDKKVFDLLSTQGPRTTQEIAEALGLTSPGIAYLCIFRLKRQGRVRHTTQDGRPHVYEVVPEAPAPTA
jgi:hypothetical protein